MFINRKIDHFISFFFILFLLSYSSCSNEVDPDWLPTFPGIEVDENTIFFCNTKDDNVHKIYAIDTSNDKKIYTYEFKNMIIYDLEYDASFDMNPYIILLDGRTLKLDVRSGKLKKIDLKYTPERLAIINNKLWISPLCAGFENSAKDHFTYDAKTEKSEYITLPEGIFMGEWTYINNKYYLAIWLDNIPDKIYNITDNKMIGQNFLGKEYSFFSLKKNILQGYLGGPPDYADIYYINSFEPLEGTLLFSQEFSLLLGVYEKENFVYFIFREGDIVKRDKNNNYLEIKKINLKDSSDFVNYCKNGYIWLVSDDNDGAYKINMDDLSYKVIK